MRSKTTAVKATLLALCLGLTFIGNPGPVDIPAAHLRSQQQVRTLAIGLPAVISLPTPPAATPAVPAQPQTVTVQAGEGFSQVAARLDPGLDWHRLCGANMVPPPYTLNAGQDLAVPTPDAAVTPCPDAPPPAPVSHSAPSDTGAGSVGYGNGDIQQIIVNAATEFGVSPDRMLRIADCESSFDPNNSFAGHDGLFQQARQYWADRVQNFDDSNPDKPLQSDNIFDPVSNSRVSAWMMSTSGFGDWQCKG